MFCMVNYREIAGEDVLVDKKLFRYTDKEREGLVFIRYRLGGKAPETITRVSVFSTYE